MHRILHALALVLLLLGLSSCAALKVMGTTVAGAVAGSPLGPAGIVGGAVLGAGGGTQWIETTRLTEERDEARKELEQARADVASARSEHVQIDAQLADLKRRIDAVPAAPPADPRVVYTPPKARLPEENWLDQTPFQWLVAKFRRNK